MATREKPMSAVLRPSQSLRRSAPYGVAVLAVAVASWLEVLIVGSEAAQLSLVPLTLAIVLSVWHGGRGPGLLALVLSALAADLLVIEPGAVLRFGSAPAIVVYAAFLAGGLIVCLAGARAFRRQQRERESSLTARLAAAQADRSAQLAVAL
jgi:diguanylate cyclase